MTGDNEELKGSESQNLLQIGKKLVNPTYMTSQKSHDAIIRKPKICETSRTINGRTILWYFTFCSTAINFMIRLNLNIAIVDMVQKIQSSHTATTSECYNHTIITGNLYTNVSTTNINANNRTKFSIERIILNLLKINFDENGFEWNEYQQGLVLSSFYWIYWVGQLPGGILARKYGTKIVFGVSNLLACLICSLLPFASFIDIKILIVFRVVQGFLAGLMWSSFQTIVARWIPPNERSRFAIAYSGKSLGVAVFYPVFGYVIAWSSWEWVFHVCTIIGIIWFIGWQYYIFDAPALHPRISYKEREYIEKSIGASLDQNNKAAIPWSRILTSVPVWINTVSFFGVAWAGQTLMTQAPTYFKQILGWNLKMTGLFSGLPHFLKLGFSVVVGIYCDHLLKTNKMSRTNVRKLTVVVINISAGIAITALAFSGCNSLMAIVFFTFGLIFSCAGEMGIMPNMVDLSPNFASIVCGITTLIGVLPGFFSPMVVGALTLNNQTTQQWQYVYLITASFVFGSAICFAIFSSSEIQQWNNTEKKEKELVELNRSVINEDVIKFTQLK